MQDKAHSYQVSIEGWRDTRRNAVLHFSKIYDGELSPPQKIEPSSIPDSPILRTLGRAKDLKIRIYTGNDPVSVCAVQDSLFAFVDRIPSEHRLRSLDNIITAVMPNDPNNRAVVVSHVWLDYATGKPLIFENKDVQPGDLSRMHVIVSLADPLRKIRNFHGKQTAITIYYEGYKAMVWRELRPLVKDLMCGDSEVQDYEAFRRYFRAVRYMIKSIKVVSKHVMRLQEPQTPAASVPVTTEPHPPTPASTPVAGIIDLTGEDDENNNDTQNPHDQPRPRLASAHESGVVDITGEPGDQQEQIGLPRLHDITKALAMARIRADFGALTLQHRRLLQLGQDAHDMASRVASTIATEDEALATAMENLRQNREYAAASLPERTDVSHYGYNEFDAKFADYRSDRNGYKPYQPLIARKRKGSDAGSKSNKKKTKSRKAPAPSMQE